MPIIEIGTRVSWYFEAPHNQWYHGTVSEVDEENSVYAIQYDDGDDEVMEADKCRVAVQNYNEQQSNKRARLMVCAQPDSSVSSSLAVVASNNNEATTTDGRVVDSAIPVASASLLEQVNSEADVATVSNGSATPGAVKSEAGVATVSNGSTSPVAVKSEADGATVSNGSASPVVVKSEPDASTIAGTSTSVSPVVVASGPEIGPVQNINATVEQIVNDRAPPYCTSYRMSWLGVCLQP